MLPEHWRRNVINTIMPSQGSPSYIDNKLGALELNSKALMIWPCIENVTAQVQDLNNIRHL